jgi:hypothetical protein
MVAQDPGVCLRDRTQPVQSGGVLGPGRLRQLEPLRGHALDGARKVAAFIVLPFGVNAIAAYVLHEISGSVLGWDLLLQPYRMASGAVGPELAAFIPVAMYIFGIWLAMFYLWKKRWIIKI